MLTPDRPRISFVIPVLNDVAGLRRCLPSLRQNGAPSPRAEIVVVDNGSTDGSAEAAAAAGARVVSVPGEKVGGLRNRGAALSRGEIIAFVDADHEIAHGWVAAVEDILSAEIVGGAGAPYVPPLHGSWVQRAYGRLRGRPSGQRQVEWLGSGNLAVRRRAFEQVGGFDTALEVCEAVDLCQRLRAAGWRLVSDERLESVHYGDPATLGAVFRSETWRGRDNLRVSLRSLTLRGLPSILIPVVDLFCLALIAAGVVSSPWGGLRIALAGFALFLALATLRVGRVLANPGPATLVAIGQVAAVSITYDVARALALVVRRRHRRAG
jgi:glycosyltransferase involved in cell wall biosynthesis